MHSLCDILHLLLLQISTTMTSPNGKWIDTRMLNIIRRTVQNQATSDSERQDMEQFLGIPSLTPVVEPRPPVYTEAPDQRHATFLPLQPLPDRWSDSGSSIRRTSTHGTNQTGSSGLRTSGKPSHTGSPQASSSGSARREPPSATPAGSPQGSASRSARRGQQSTAGSPHASPSGSARHARSPTTSTGSPQTASSGPTQRGRFHADTSVGESGDWDPELILPDPRRAGDGSNGGS